VRQLFEPLLARVTREEREELLSGAAALATPLFEPEQLASEVSTEGSLALLHGLYWLTVNAAARRPLLLAVDDLHWCDASSLRWLAYLLPRMEGLGVAVVVCTRSGEPGADPAVLAQILSDPLATVVRPAPLSAGAVSELVRRTLSPDADDSFGAACHEETGGNPQLLRELMQAVAAERVAPSGANIARARELGGRAGLRPVVARLARLRPEATTLAQAVAILGADADPRQAAALADLDRHSAFEAASDLVRVDILRHEPPLGFAHPLVRAAMYSMLTAVEREQGHARAARLLVESGAEPERVAAHLLRTAPGGDAAVVRTLRAAAQGALARAAPESAIAYLLRALDEPPPQEERAGVLLDLGTAETLVSGRAAVEHLREAYELIEDPIRRAEAGGLLGRHLFLRHLPDESAEVLRAALADLGSAHAELSRRLQAALVHTAMMEPRLYALALELLARIRGRPSDVSAGEKMLLGLLAYHDARANMPADVAVDLARRALAGGVLGRAAKGGGPFIMSSIVLAMADVDEALEVYDNALAEAHRTGSVFAFATVKAFRSQAFLYRGDLHEAEREGREALEACDAWASTWPRAG
jgi:tetratricopeptide (TPR) repeat protein